MNKRMLKALMPLGGFIILAGLLGFGLTRDPSLIPSEMLDRPFPEFTVSTLADPNAAITEETLKGEVSLVNIFGSWCVSCVQEHPKLMDISRRDQVRLIGIDWRDTRENAKRWLDHYGDPYDLILFDADSRLAIALGVTGAPESFIVDKTGQVRYKHVGIITEQVWDDIIWPIIVKLEAET